MHIEVALAIIAILSWTASTFFTNGVEAVADNYFLEKSHNKAIVYFLFSLVFLIGTVWFAIKYKK